MSLDDEILRGFTAIERLLVVYGSVLGALLTPITVAVYFDLVRPQYERLHRQERVLHSLQKQLGPKQASARLVDAEAGEKEVVERRLQQALSELPNEANIDEVIRSIADHAQKVGLTINDIAPQAEKRHSFYARIPIVMAVTGTYHDIRACFAGLSRLPRGVNVANIRMGHPQMQGDKLIVSATFVAEAFRLVPGYY